MQLFKGSNGQLKTKAIFWTAVFIVIIVCVAYFLLFYYVVHVNMEKRGQFGDMFGFIGALFSGLAFAGLIVTMLQQREDLQNQKDEIILQRKDLEAQTEALRLQKEEIAQTNKELELQRQEMAEQNKTIMLQRFENTFFNMLSFQMNICEQVKCSTSVSSIKGDAAIEYLFNKLKDNIRSNSIDIQNTFYFELDHYNRHLSQILNMVDGAHFLTIEEKNRYVGILISHLSYYELAMVFYYGISLDGKTRAKSLIEKYAFFRDFGKNTIFAPEHLKIYNDGAYTVRNE